MSKSLGLALGSGGARGAAHVGFLRALEERNIKPDYIAGCSMGAVVGACYAKGLSVDYMTDELLKLKTSDLVDLSVTAVTKLGLLKGVKLQKILTRYIGNVTFDQLKTPFCCVATDIRSGKLVLLNEGSVAKAVQASSSIPMLFQPVELNGSMLCDGGVLCRVPVKQVKKMGADVVVAVDVLANTGEEVDVVPNIVQKALRVFDIMDNNQNQLLKKANRRYYDLWLAPPMEGLNQYNVKDVEKAYNAGYAFGKEHVGEIEGLLEE